MAIRSWPDMVEDAKILATDRNQNRAKTLLKKHQMERRLRDTVPSVNDAWEKYQVVLRLAMEADNGI